MFNIIETFQNYFTRELSYGHTNLSNEVALHFNHGVKIALT